MKICTVVGARPQFIKAAAVSRVAREEYGGRIDEVLVHTGQHHDDNMSKVFFEQLQIPHPRHNLEISGGSHGEMTGRMLEAIERVLLDEKPDWLLIYGDTNSTLAGAVAAAKLHIPIAHVEAGLRSFNMRMPEEINRILADRVSSLLFCPTDEAVANLRNEGIHQGVHNVGDVMYDIALYYGDRALRDSTIGARLGLEAGSFALATCHRAENTDERENLAQILGALAQIAEQFPVVLPLHPRTRKFVERFGLSGLLSGITVVEPLPFLDVLALEKTARVVLTDSGGVQKEAYFYEVPCLTMRDETEWVETIAANANVLVGANRERILDWTAKLLDGRWTPDFTRRPYGDGNAATKLLQIMAA